MEEATRTHEHAGPWRMLRAATRSAFFGSLVHVDAALRNEEDKWSIYTTSGDFKQDGEDDDDEDDDYRGG